MLVLKTTIEIVPCVFDAGTSNEDVHAGIFSHIAWEGTAEQP